MFTFKNLFRKYSKRFNPCWIFLDFSREFLMFSSQDSKQFCTGCFLLVCWKKFISSLSKSLDILKYTLFFISELIHTQRFVFLILEMIIVIPIMSMKNLNDIIDREMTFFFFLLKECTTTAKRSKTIATTTSSKYRRNCVDGDFCTCCCDLRINFYLGLYLQVGVVHFVFSMVSQSNFWRLCETTPSYYWIYWRSLQNTRNHCNGFTNKPCLALNSWLASSSIRNHTYHDNHCHNFTVQIDEADRLLRSVDYQ